MPVGFASVNQVNQSNLFGRDIDKAESCSKLLPLISSNLSTCDTMRGEISYLWFCKWLDITSHKKCPLKSNRSSPFSCRKPAVTKQNPCKEMVVMTPAPSSTTESTVNAPVNEVNRDFLTFIICPRKFQNVQKNQLPFGQNVQNWFWSSWITENYRYFSM